MPARIIDFKTRELINADEVGVLDVDAVVTPAPDITVIAPVTGSMALNHEETPLTPVELFNLLYQRSAQDLSALITFYKHTGKWNTTAELLMRRAAENIKAVCASLAGEK
jgi:hypothetical protein